MQEIGMYTVASVARRRSPREIAPTRGMRMEGKERSGNGGGRNERTATEQLRLRDANGEAIF